MALFGDKCLANHKRTRLESIFHAVIHYGFIDKSYRYCRFALATGDGYRILYTYLPINQFHDYAISNAGAINTHLTHNNADNKSV